MAKVTKKQITLRLLIAVLLDGISYPANTALLIGAEQGQSLVDDGLADANEAAVEYALTQGKLVTHATPVAEKSESDPVVDEAAADPIVEDPVVDPVADPPQE